MKKKAFYFGTQFENILCKEFIRTCVTENDLGVFGKDRDLEPISIFKHGLPLSLANHLMKFEYLKNWISVE